jgi:hypothetical protein
VEGADKCGGGTVELVLFMVGRVHSVLNDVLEASCNVQWLQYLTVEIYRNLKSNGEKLQYFTCHLVVSLSEVADYKLGEHQPACRCIINTSRIHGDYFSRTILELRMSQAGASERTTV